MKKHFFINFFTALYFAEIFDPTYSRFDCLIVVLKLKDKYLIFD